MRRLAASLDVSAPALYHHFGNRQELLDAVAERAFGMFERVVRKVEASEAEGVVRGVLEAYREFAAAEPHLFGLIFVEPRSSARRFPSDFAGHRSPVFNLLWKAVQEHRDASADDSLHLAHELWAMAHGHVSLWRAGRFDDDATFQRVLDSSVARLLGPGRA